MVGKYKVITLCGSTRFKDAFMEAQKKLTLEGNIVISVGLFGHSGDSEVWEGMSEDTLTQTKLMLDDMHKRKIDMADEIFVINVGGYIGMSTKSEIDYANATGKIVRYMEDDEQKWTSLYFRPGQTGSEGGINLFLHPLSKLLLGYHQPVPHPQDREAFLVHQLVAGGGRDSQQFRHHLRIQKQRQFFV